MALTAGVISLVKKYHDKIEVASTNATGGTGPYTVAWYISKTSGFSPDESSATSATGLHSTITGLVPGQQYYVKAVYTDTGASGATVTSDQLAVQTDAQGFNQNAFTQAPGLGEVDLRYSVNTISRIAGEDLVSGQAVKIGSDNKVHACTANTDRVDGFIVLSSKKNAFHDGDALEIARGGSYITLRATSDLSAGDACAIDPTCIGGVTAIVSTETPVGQAMWTAAAGSLVVVYLACPAL
jgi:hypothetical protein